MATFSDYVEVEAELDLSPNEILDNCSDRECQELTDLLYESGYYPKSSSNNDESFFANGTTYTEQELAKTLVEIWRARNLLNQSQLARIHAITRESYV
jgi:hypothetical protein